MNNDQEGYTSEVMGHIRAYIKTLMDLLRLQLVENSSMLLARVVGFFCFGMIISALFFFGSMSLGYFLGGIFGNTYSGFLVICGGYLLLFIVLYAGRRRGLYKWLANVFVRLLLNQGKTDEKQDK